MAYSRRKEQPPKRKARLGSDYGLVRRVARKLGVSEEFVSKVKTGKMTSARVTAALEAELALMREEQQKVGGNAA